DHLLRHVLLGQRDVPDVEADVDGAADVFPLEEEIVAREEIAVAHDVDDLADAARPTALAIGEGVAAEVDEAIDEDALVAERVGHRPDAVRSGAEAEEHELRPGTLSVNFPNPAGHVER